MCVQTTTAADVDVKELDRQLDRECDPNRWTPAMKARHRAKWNTEANARLGRFIRKLADTRNEIAAYAADLDDGGEGAALVEQLEKHGCDVIRRLDVLVTVIGDAMQDIGSFRPGHPDDANPTR